MLTVFLGDAGTVVSDFDAELLCLQTCRDADTWLGDGRVGVHHGLGRIAQQVQQHLFDLRFRAGDFRQEFIVIADDLDPFEIILFLQIVVAGRKIQGTIECPRMSCNENFML